VIGMVLAAGASRRLRPDTDHLPKALLPVAGTTTILDIALGNLAAVGLTDVAVIVGHAAGVIADRAAALEREHGVRIELIHNDRAQDWNNATRCGSPASTSARARCWSTATRCTRSAWRTRC